MYVESLTHAKLLGSARRGVKVKPAAGYDLSASYVDEAGI
jgi:hypothetical protein